MWHYMYILKVSLKSIQYVFNYGKNNENSARVSKNLKKQTKPHGTSESCFLASGLDGQSVENMLVLLVYSECF